MYKKLEQEMAKLEVDLERLRTLFEQYFMGLEKTPPISLKNDISRYIRRSDFKKVHNTELRFRFRSLSQKYASYCAYWDRTMRMIEEGTFKRDRFASPNASHPVMRRRLRRMHAGDDAAASAPHGDARRRAHAERLAADRRGEKSTTAAPAPDAASSGTPPGDREPFEKRLRPLYRRFVQARVANGESVKNLTFDAFKRSVTKTRASHMAKFQCGDLDYQVKTRDGRVSLVAQPLRDDA